MKRRGLLSLAIVLGTLSRAGAIDLTPATSEYTAEGITFRQLTFKDGKRKVVYEPPRLWGYRGGGTSLQLMPPKGDRTEAMIQVAVANPPLSFDDKGVAALKEQFMRTLPPGSQTATITNEEQNPVRLENSASYAVTGSYKIIGEIFERSVLFVNLPDAQLTFKFTARKADFEKLHQAFRRSILSWRWIEQRATPDAGPVTASIR
jgi:hypothetical protein